MTKSDLRQYQRPHFPLPPTTKWSEIKFYANRTSTTTSTNAPLAVGFATECNKIPGILTYPIEIHHNYKRGVLVPPFSELRRTILKPLDFLERKKLVRFAKYFFGGFPRGILKDPRGFVPTPCPKS